MQIIEAIPPKPLVNSVKFLGPEIRCGDHPSEFTPEDVARFWSKVKVGRKTECWEWLGHKVGAGYGRFGLKKKLFLSHRFAWMWYFNLPLGNSCLCHKCDNPSCVNPNHVFKCTHQENMQDAVAKGRRPKRNFCMRGHEMKGNNLYMPPRGGRICRACVDIRRKKWLNKKQKIITA